jgi:hypothetical protein
MDARAGQPTGIITVAGIARSIADGKNVNDVWVDAVMTIRPATTTGIRDAAEIMTARHFRHLPVAGDTGLVGVLDIIDVCRALIHAGDGRPQTGCRSGPSGTARPLSCATYFVGIRVCRTEPGIMWPTEVVPHGSRNERGYSPCHPET